MSAEMDRLVASVAANGALIDSAVAAFAGLAQQIRDAAGDRERTNALADDLDAKGTTLAAAIPAGTPAESIVNQSR